MTNLTGEGRVMIPSDVRDALGLRPGEPVEIDWRGGDEAVIRKPRPRVVDQAAFEAELARLEAFAEEWKHLRNGQTTDEYMAEIREPLP